MKSALNERNKLIAKLEDEVRIERDEKMDLLHEQEKFKLDTEMKQELWTQETMKLRKEIDNMNEIVLTNQKGVEDNFNERIRQEKDLLLNEHDSDRQAYQKLLQEYHCLELHCESLQKQVHHRLPSHSRNISDVSSVIDENTISTTNIAEDHGYDSVKSTASTASIRGKLDNINWNEGTIKKTIKTNKLLN